MGVIPPPDDSTVMAEINITPLTDVLLVLLVIFMVSATFITQTALNVKLPEAITREPSPPGALVVTVRGTPLGARILVGGAEAAPEALQIHFDREAQSRPGRKVILQADVAVPHGAVMEILDKLKRAGFSSIALATKPPR